MRADTLKLVNTLSFLNLPVSKHMDPNFQILSEIVCRLREAKSQKDLNFLPYNKSILTRVMYEQIRKHNFLAVSHFTKPVLAKALNSPF